LGGAGRSRPAWQQWRNLAARAIGVQIQVLKASTGHEIDEASDNGYSL